MNNICIAFPEYDYKYLFHRLTRLVDMGYVEVLKFNGNSRRNPNIYKVTSKTCSYHNNPKSYKVKNHSDEYIKRKLIENEFLSRLYKNYDESIYTEHHDKVDYLKTLGYKFELMPKKFKGTVTHIEECIIARNELKHEYINMDKDLIFVYTDDMYKSVESQIKDIINKYKEMIKDNEESTIETLVITEDQNRRNIYIKFLNKILSTEDDESGNKGDNLEFKLYYPNIEYVKLYLGYLSKYNMPRYLFLADKLKLQNLNEEQQIIKVRDYIKDFSMNYKPDLERLKTVTALKYDDFKAVIKSEIDNKNHEEIRHLFSSAFLIQVNPDILKLYQKIDIDNSTILRMNFNIITVEKST
jgi:hypothetical protein